MTLSDGRVYVFGGHDMQSNNGLYKVNIFDPETETWVSAVGAVHPVELDAGIRSAGVVRAEPERPVLSTAAIRGTSRAPSPPTPPTRSTPAGIHRRFRCRTTWCWSSADSTRTTLSPPDPDRVTKGTANQSQNDTAFTASRVNIVVPEVYDPETDRNIALENARMAFPLYPQMEVVQTGPGRDDWKVCTFNGEIDYGTSR